MTRDEILKMPAGQDMDLLVAEEFLKLDSIGWNERFFHNRAKFSTDIRAAWEVAEKLSGNFDFALVNNQNFGKYPDMHYGFRLQAVSKTLTIFALGETAPLAICRAALLAVEAK